MVYFLLQSVSLNTMFRISASSEALADQNSSSGKTIGFTHVKRCTHSEAYTELFKILDHSSKKCKQNLGKVATGVTTSQRWQRATVLTLSHGVKIQQPINRHSLGKWCKPCYLAILILFLFYWLIQLPSLLQSSAIYRHFTPKEMDRFTKLST